MVVLVADMPLDGLVDLVNGWGTTPRQEAGEQNWPYPPLQGLTNRLGVPPSLEPASDASAQQIADRLHPVFAHPLPVQRIQLVNRLLSDTRLRPTLSEHPEPAADNWLAADRQAVLAAAAAALYRHIAANGPDRLGICSGARCADAYIDASPNRQRRYCSITCQNRARIAAYRSRQSH